MSEKIPCIAEVVEMLARVNPHRFGRLGKPRIRIPNLQAR